MPGDANDEQPVDEEHGGSDNEVQGENGASEAVEDNGASESHQRARARLSFKVGLWLSAATTVAASTCFAPSAHDTYTTTLRQRNAV